MWTAERNSDVVLHVRRLPGGGDDGARDSTPIVPVVLRTLILDGIASAEPSTEFSLAVPKSVSSKSISQLCETDAFLGEEFDEIAQVRPYLGLLSVIPLRPFQEAGVEWLRARKVGILADDMGLGKTIQALAAVRALVATGAINRVLVLAPRSLVINWYREARTWTPELATMVLMPSSASAQVIWRDRPATAHLVITSYEQLRSHQSSMNSCGFDLVVADEAHRLRNMDAALTRAFRKLSRPRTWLLTGTPVERDAEDLANLLATLDPGRFAATDSKRGVGPLRARARPYIMRRTKQEVLRELPSSVEKHETIQLSKEQRESYRRELGLPQPFALVKFGRLREICDADPLTGSSSKLDRIVEVLESITAAGERAVVFSYWTRPLELLRARLASHPDLGEPLLLSGSSTVRERDGIVGEFRESATRHLLASSRVASEGLTLVEANHAIFINRWWNPSSNAQARDRIARIGQTRSTTVYTFTSVGTVEEIVDSMLVRKSRTDEALIQALNEHWSGR